MKLATTFSALALLLFTASALARTTTEHVSNSPWAATSSQELAYQEMAKSFLSTMGFADATTAEAAPKILLNERFLMTELGLFDVWIPRAALAEQQVAEDYRSLCMALLDAQSEWTKWLGESAVNSAPLLKDLQEQRQWIEGWKAAQLATSASVDAKRAVDLFRADDATRARAKSIAQAFRSAAVLGQSRSEEKAVQLVLMPKRKTFVEFIAYAGWQLPGSRSNYWQKGIESWSQFYIDDLQVLALEYASPTATGGDYAQSYSMRIKTPTGMEQQVVQLGLNKLLEYEHGDSLPASFVTGLSINLVTKIFGECYTRVDGDVGSKVTASREVFVRGGRSEGGILPPNSADSRWRAEHGKHYYAPVLKQAQKAGASNKKRAKNKYSAFELQSEDGNARYITSAPLLGPSALQEEVVPDAVYGDYLEFTRAYQSAFLHWLQHEGFGSKKKSEAAFSEFLGRLRAGAESPNVAEVAAEVYGQPLSDSEASKKSLEGRFLIWLSKQ